MTVPLRQSWTQEEFFAWAGSQEGHYEFDGFLPVGMTGGNLNHAVIMGNLHSSLRDRLRRGSCRPLGPDAGLATVGNAVRYPDALVTCSPFDGTALTTPGVIVVFEIVSPNSSRNDRIIKVREYAAVASIRRYVILESTNVGLTVMDRQLADETWRVVTLTNEDTLHMPEIGIDIPVAELYEDVSFPDEAAATGH
jgi:Uma2 family endonuclease